MRALPAVLTALLPLLLTAGPAPAAEVVANTGSTRIAFAAREWLDVGLDVNGLVVERLRLHQPGKVKGLLVSHDEANRGRLVLTNRTDRRIKPAVAVSIFDAEGRLLAAANTGIRTKGVNPGETEEMDLHFGGVFRYIERGAWLYVALEY